MTKKHFIAFANQIRAMVDRGTAQATAFTVIAVAKQDNPRFDEQRFLAACGL